jgi:hypothetical protein
MMSKLATIMASVVAVLAGAAQSGCGGQTGPPERGFLVSGQGISAAQPPWQPQYPGLAQRIKKLGLPTGESEKFHIHALLSIYNNGLLIPVPANIGIDKRRNIETTIHTHDATGVIHMEAPRPFRYTLGDLFAIWGVRFGAGTLGGLEDSGKDRVWVYVNGKPISDPARYVLRNGDNISIGYGTQSSFPHRPGTYVLKQVMEGKGGFSCNGGPTKKQKSCLAPKPAKKTTRSS